MEKIFMTTRYPPEHIILRGTHVDLLPLQEEHHDALCRAAKDGELWNLWFTGVPSPDGMNAWITNALTEQREQKSLPFAVLRKSDNTIVGSTRYMNIERGVRRLEIGSTWYAKSAQKSFVNTECKFLLLQHAFEQLECIAVEFRTHRMNEESRRAIQRLGAVQDGILRNHRVMPNGTLRDTVVYSIIAGEWQTVKAHLLYKLSKP